MTFVPPAFFGSSLYLGSSSPLSFRIVVGSTEGRLMRESRYLPEASFIRTGRLQ
jgi:hypothetical protein